MFFSGLLFFLPSVSVSADRKDEILCRRGATGDAMMCVCVSLSKDVLNGMARFSVQGVFNYSMLTLSDHERVLYVGARETLFALDPNDISRQLRRQVTHAQTHKHTRVIIVY